ncbi:LamG domain-containing protein [Streptomyces erythrochromogenes]|uniref:LamG domain-containing protein n=1 Tax=Streptomyces erythrochromogenes TaxID=285574 RepID=A0ABZ1QHQ8_9ACTN|nr:LamG-like jellyroll fold domain-containing protein [Streptomyces erythrochromogenes]
MVYEGGATFSAAHIYFKRFHPADLGIPGQTRGGPGNTQQAPLPGRTTPDNTPQANDAYLTGNTTLEPGRFRQALKLTGPGSYADIPYTPAIDPGTADATYSFHFKHHQDPANAPRVLMWAYGHDAVNPQVWIRAHPKDNKIVARVEGENGHAVTATVETPAAFADGEWHFLSLVREGNAVRLTVDDARATTTGTLTGALSTAHRGIRLGAKPNDTAQDPLTGSLDDFRIYKRALTDDPTAPNDELDKIRAAVSGTGSYPAGASVWWNMEHGTVQIHDMYNRPRNGPATPDGTVHGNNAYVRGTPGITGTGGKCGGALDLDGDDSVELPPTDSEALGTADFTLATWVRFDPAALPLPSPHPDPAGPTPPPSSPGRTASARPNASCGCAPTRAPAGSSASSRPRTPPPWRASPTARSAPPRSSSTTWCSSGRRAGCR